MRLKSILNEDNYGIENAVEKNNIKKWTEKDDYNELNLDDNINCNVIYIYEVSVSDTIDLTLKDIIIDHMYDDNGSELPLNITKEYIEIAREHFENIKNNFIDKAKYIATKS